MEDRVVLVDEHDRETGTAGKLAAHTAGARHRAFSVFVFDDADRMLLQRRASSKYHSGGLWANSCCGHPRPGEPVERAAVRRLAEEMGFSCRLAPVCSVVYRADVGGGLVEHEYDHVFIGRYDGAPIPDPAEVDAWRWSPVESIAADLAERPQDFAAWFPIMFTALRAHRQDTAALEAVGTSS